MDCVVLKEGEGNGQSQYRVRWNASGVSRVDMNSTGGAKQTLWVSNGIFSVAEHAGETVRSTKITTIPPEWQPPMELLTPKILAQHIEEQYGLMQAVRLNGPGPDKFLLVGQEGHQVIEIAIDTKTCFPTTLKEYLPDSTRTGGRRDALEEARFQWNEPINPGLLVPESSAGQHPVH
jgi:hypothetical protein